MTSFQTFEAWRQRTDNDDKLPAGFHETDILWYDRQYATCTSVGLGLEEEIVISTKRFGRTENLSSRILFGGVALAEATQTEADAALDILLEYGINHIDTAAGYGDAELRIGPWMDHHRKDFFLATKNGATQLRGGVG